MVQALPELRTGKIDGKQEYFIPVGKRSQDIFDVLLLPMGIGVRAYWDWTTDLPERMGQSKVSKHENRAPTPILLTRIKKLCRIEMHRRRASLLDCATWPDHMARMREKLERFAIAFDQRIYALNSVDWESERMEGEAP